MTDFDMENIRNLTITKRFRQIPISDVDFYNLSADQATLMVEGRPQNWFINEFMHFTGVIKRVDKDDNKPIYHIHSEGAGSILRDTILDIDEVYKDTAFTNILPKLLPANWKLLWNDGGIDYTVSGHVANFPSYQIPKIWYHVTPGSALSHLSNIVRLMGFEWEVDQEVTDAESGTFGDYIFRISTHLGSTTSVKDYVNNTNCFNLIQKQNADKVFTSINAVGNSPESARMTSQITADDTFTKFSTLTSNESYLTSAITAATTLIPVADPTCYYMPCIVNIENENILCSSYSGSNLVVTTRGLGSVAAAHPTNADVLNLSELRFSPDITLTASNASVVVGSEVISYANKAAGRIYSTPNQVLGRNTVTGTLSYSHHKGAMVRPRNIIPTTTSYASLNGIREVTVDAMGAIDRDGVDLKASILVTKTATSTPYGSFYSTDTDVWQKVTLGDAITVTQAATWIASTTTVASHQPDGTIVNTTGVPCKIKDTPVEIDTRIIGITWNQYKPVMIEYGDVDMFILDDFANAAKAYNSAINRNSNTTSATVAAVSANDPSCIQVPVNGKLVWAKKV